MEDDRTPSQHVIDPAQMVAAAREAANVAVTRAFASGNPVTVGRNGRLLRIYKDGQVEDLGPLK